MSLRVGARRRGQDVDKKRIADLLGRESDTNKTRHWSLSAPVKAEADLNFQVHWILSRLTNDLAVWKRINKNYDVDLFCGLFLERLNRGVDLTAQSMAALGARGIKLGLDIYAPDA